MTQRVVQKYGGTSVGSTERIRNVAKRVAASAARGDQVVVVVSAMAGETDRLLGLAGDISQAPPKREMDLLLSSGEQVTISLLAMALEDLGHKSKGFLGGPAGIVTDLSHTKARIQNLDSAPLVKAIEEGYIPVVAGFQGRTEDGEITTLGRGGSDLTAVAVAYAVKADVCEIYTDVDGVYTTDPRKVKDARKIERISFEEMLELASSGAKVLQTRSVEFAMKYNMPLHVRSSLSDVEGTWVVKEEDTMEGVLVSGLAHNEKESKIAIRRVPDTPGIAAAVFQPLADANVNVDMIVQNVSADGFTDLTFTVLDTEVAEALRVLNSNKDKISFGHIDIDTDIAKVSIVGVGMRTHAGVAAKMFTTLADNDINVQMISTSEIKVSCVIKREKIDRALEVLHAAFELDKAPSA